MGGLAVVSLTGAAGESHAATAAVGEIKTISRQPRYYHGWPTVIRRRNGDLVLVYSGGRAAHVCPFGRIELMTSRDEGATWSWPRTILDTDLDDRDAGVVESASGALIVTTFSSLAYELALNARENAPDKTAAALEELSAWKAARDRLSAEQRRTPSGCLDYRLDRRWHFLVVPTPLPRQQPSRADSAEGRSFALCGKRISDAGRTRGRLGVNRQWPHLASAGRNSRTCGRQCTLRVS